MESRRGGRSFMVLGLFLIAIAWIAPFGQAAVAQSAPPPIAPPGEQMSAEEIAYWESSVPCPPGPDGLQLTGASYTGNMLPNVSIACTYADPADASTTYSITVEWNKPQSGQAYYCSDSDDLTQVAVGTHDAIIRLEPFEASEARLAALAEAAAPLRDWVAGVADECPAKIPCPTIDGVSAPYEANAAYYQQEGSVLIFGGNTRTSTLSMATCGYSSADDGTTSDEPRADGASIEVFWASPSTTDLDRQRPCLLEETFGNGIGTVTLGGEAAAYAVYSISAMEPVDPVPFETAARELLNTVAPQAASCEGIEALETETPLPGNLAAAFDTAASVAGGDDSAPPAEVDTTAPAPAEVTSSTTATGDTSEWYTWPLRLIGIAAMVLSIVTLAATFARVRRATLIHPRLDVARVVVIAVVALIMLAIFSATAPLWAVVVAIVGGAALGFWQGDHLVVRQTARGMTARRTGWAVIAFGAGVVVTQVAGYLDRAGVITLGIALSFLSGAIAAGLIVGRRPRIADAKRAAATTTTVLLLAFVVGAFATVDKTEAQGDDPDVVLPAEREVGDEALIDLVDWNNVRLRGGLFADEGKPFQVVPVPRALDTAPVPATFTTTWTYDDGSGPQQYSATETYTFGLRPDGLCCTVDYSGTGTVTDATGAVSNHEAAGRLDDIQSVAVEGSPGAPVRSEAVGTPFTAPQSFAEPGAAVPAGVDTDPAACGRVVGETRSPYDLEEVGGSAALTTYSVDGQPSTPPEEFGRVAMITDCEIEGFTAEAGLALAPPPPPIDDATREGGCPVFQEMIGQLSAASQFPGVDTSTTAQAFLSPNAAACTMNVTLGQEGPGGTRHELVYSLTRPTDPAFGTESTWVDGDYWNDLPQPYEFPPETRCAVDASGAPVAPADPAVGCSLMTRHQIDETKVAIWTDWTLIEGPNVLVFVTAPWGSYVYRCHHCTPTDPSIVEFLSALNAFTADAAAQIAEASASAPADVPTDTPAQAPADGTAADATEDTGDEGGGVEEAPLVGVVGMVGALGLYLLTLAEGDEPVDGGQKRDGQGDGREQEQEERYVPAWVHDPRPLSEIWAEEAGLEAQRHGGNLVWDPENNALVKPGYQSPEQLERIQRDARDRWHQLSTTLEGAPGLAGTAAFVREAATHVVRPDGTIDVAALEKVERSVDRLGQLELGEQRVGDYTMANAAWDTAGQAAANPVVRVGASLLLSPAVDPLLQTISMANRSEHMVSAGMSDEEIDKAMTDELVLYGATNVVGLAGGQLISANAGALRGAASSVTQRALQQLPDDVAGAVSRTGQRTLQTLEQLGHAGATNVTEAVERGVQGTWRHAGNLTRISQLTAANSTLGTAVDDLYRQIDEIGPSRVLSRTHEALNPLEQRALDLLRTDPAGYQQAVRSGLIPPDVHRTVNWARDRLVRNAIDDAVNRLGPDSGLARIDITGTGARPLSTRATSGWTDVDLTALGNKEAELAFRQHFMENLERGFGGTNAAEALDVTCFAGRSGSPAGYTDPRLLRWVKVEANFTGRTVRVTPTGETIFDYQPEAALSGAPPRLTSGMSATSVRADIRRLMALHPTDPSLPLLDRLRIDGKFAQRVWKVESTGLSGGVPEGIRVLERIKADRRWVPSTGELRAAEAAFIEYTT